MKKVALDSIVVTVLNGIAQAASFLLFVVIAALFGADWQTDAFFLAMTIPAIFVGTAINAVTSVFIPVMAECRVRRPEALGSLIGSAILYAFVWSIVGAVVVALLSPLAMQVGEEALSDESRHFALRHSTMLLPVIPLQTLIGVMAAAFNSAGRFWLPAASTTARFLVSILLVLALRPFFGVDSLPIGFIVGVLFNLIILAAFWTRLNTTLTFSWHVEPELARSFRLALPMLVSMAALYLIDVVSLYLAARLPAGSISIYDYATRISGGIMELLTGGVMLVVLADWSTVVAIGDGSALRPKLSNAILTTLFVILPIIVILAVMRESIIVLALERGKFDNIASAKTAGVLLILLLSIPADIVMRLYYRLFLVWQETAKLAILSVMTLLVVIVTALPLMAFIEVRGLAVAYLVGVVFLMVVLILAANRRLGNTLTELWVPALKLTLAVLAQVVAMTWLLQSMSQPPVWVALPSVGLFGIVTYLVTSWLLRIRQITWIGKFVGWRKAVVSE